MSVELTIECDFCPNLIEDCCVEHSENFSPDSELECSILLSFPSDEGDEPRWANVCEECAEKFNAVIMGQ